MLILPLRDARGEQVQMGVDVFLQSHTHLMKGHRVGLITNPTGRTASGVSTISALQDHPDVDLRVLFALEHGIDAKANAGAHIKDAFLGGLPVLSLYGGGNREQALDTVDVLVYDIQDVGSRAYTYIWSLTRMMGMAALQGKRVFVFDRPNPLGGLTVDGPVMEEKMQSLIGLYPVPRVYGMTVGELALFVNKEFDIGCDLTVIPMAGYRRNMCWDDIGVPWVPPSPNIPSSASAVCFAATGTIGTLGILHIGILTETPFQLVGAPWVDAEESAKDLNAMQLPGVRFQPRVFAPEKGLFRGEKVQAVFLDVVDPIRFQPARTEVALLAHFRSRYPDHFEFRPGRAERFDRAMGTRGVREALMRGDEARQIWSQWSAEVLAFSMKRQSYLLYRSGSLE